MRVADRIYSIRQDFAYSIRQLRRAPAFSTAVIVTLGIGIGANATMFGAIDQLLLRPPAYIADPARVVTFALRDTRIDATRLQQVLSYPIYEDLRRATDAFSHVGIFRYSSIDFGAGAQIKSVPAELANAEYFTALGIHPVVGRFFNGDEANDHGGAPVAVLGYDFWRRELAGDRSVVGRTITLSGAPHTVIGIAPPGFTGTGLTAIDVWLPLTDGMSPSSIAGLAQQRQMYAYTLVARLAPGMTEDRASEIATAAVLLGERKDGQTEAQIAAVGRRVVLTSVLPRDVRGNAPEAKVAELLGAVSLFVLLPACANVMNLQLARGIRRRREIAVRIALGISRGRLVRQLALDCLVLSLAGGVAGVITARFGGQFVRQTLLGRTVGSLSILDTRVLGVSLLATVLAALLAGLVPAIELLRSDLVTALKAGARSGDSKETSRLRAILLGAQATLTTVLLIGTGLFVLSLRRIETVPLGFDPAHAAVARLKFTAGPPFSEDTDEERARVRVIFRTLEETARETPGVSAASIALTAPFEGGYARDFSIPGHDSTPVTREGGPYFNAVSPDYFKSIGARLVAGRSFNAGDQAAASRVVIVNEMAARMWWPGETAVGRCVLIDGRDGPCAEVVGVVQNTHRRRIVEDGFVQVFVPVDQAVGLRPGVVIFRTEGQIDDVIPSVQRRLQVALAGLPSVNVRPLDALVAPGMRSWKLGAVMFGVFGGIALVLAAIGLYAVLAYDVAQRRQELGVRRALGAAELDLASLVARRGMVTVGFGALIGAAAAVATRRIVEPLLFHTSWHEPTVYAEVALVMGAVCLAATALPAWRASRVDPNVALRGE